MAHYVINNNFHVFRSVFFVLFCVNFWNLYYWFHSIVDGIFDSIEYVKLLLYSIIIDTGIFQNEFYYKWHMSFVHSFSCLLQGPNLARKTTSASPALCTETPSRGSSSKATGFAAPNSRRLLVSTNIAEKIFAWKCKHFTNMWRLKYVKFASFSLSMLYFGFHYYCKTVATTLT